MGPSLFLRASSSEPPLRAQLKRRQPSRVASRRITGQLGEQQCTLQRRCLSRRPVSPRCLSPQARAVRRLPRRHQACIGRTAACGGCHRASASLAAPPPWQPRRFSPAPSAPPLQHRPQAAPLHARHGLVGVAHVHVDARGCSGSAPSPPPSRTMSTLLRPGTPTSPSSIHLAGIPPL